MSVVAHALALEQRFAVRLVVFSNSIYNIQALYGNTVVEEKRYH